MQRGCAGNRGLGGCGQLGQRFDTRYEYMSAAERAKQVEYLGRYGQDRIRKIAKRLKADLVRAA